MDQFKAMFRRVQEDFHQLSEEEQRADMGQYTARHQEEMLDYIYDHLARVQDPRDQRRRALRRVHAPRGGV